VESWALSDAGTHKGSISPELRDRPEVGNRIKEIREELRLVKDVCFF